MPDRQTVHRPIYPCTLQRDPDGHGYRTSDGRYRVLPTYADNPMGGRTARINGWVVKDAHDANARSQSYFHLSDVRATYCTPAAHMPWLVCDSVDGVLRRARTMNEAAWWLCRLGTVPVRGRHHRGELCYEYLLGPSGPGGTRVVVVRADKAHQYGWDPHQQPRFPLPSKPFAVRARAGEGSAS